jgi:transcriptional regulator GlxA family with amidase domain
MQVYHCNQAMTKFVFLLLPHIHLLDLAGFDQTIHEAIDYGADFKIEYCHLQQGIITTSGLPIGGVNHYTKIALNKGDFIIIPGSDTSYLKSSDFKKNTDLFKWLTSQHKAGVNLCSICVGAFVLAEAGLLDYLSCTTHFKQTKELQKCYPKIKVIENILFTEGTGIYTSAGIASGIDLSLHIIEQLNGGHFAHKVARELVVYNRRNANTPQESEFMKFRNHIHYGIHKAQDWIVEHIDRKASLVMLSELANMSNRNFTRIFKKETGITVNDFITVIRKETALELLKNPNLSRAEIAQRVGLNSDRQLSRILKNH